MIQQATLEHLKTLAISATLWCVLLAVVGALTITVGICLVAGVGWGLLTFGVLCILASSVLRRGVSRA